MKKSAKKSSSKLVKFNTDDDSEATKKTQNLDLKNCLSTESDEKKEPDVELIKDNRLFDSSAEKTPMSAIDSQVSDELSKDVASPISG